MLAMRVNHLVLKLCFVLLLVLPCPAGVHAVTPELAWSVTYDGTGSPPPSQDAPAWVALDGVGNILVTGSSKGNGSTPDYATVKYDPDGVQLWVAAYGGPDGLSDYPACVATDPAGNVYVAGTGEEYASGRDYATVKYDPDGVELWVARYDGPAGGDDLARSHAVDPLGNVYVTGTSVGSDAETDLATVKYDPDGQELWAARYDEPNGDAGYPVRLALDPVGNVYVTSRVDGEAASSTETILVKYDADGNQVWARRHADGLASQPSDLAVDDAGNVFVTGGQAALLSGMDVMTIKYAPDGTRLWARTYSRVAGLVGGEGGLTLATDSGGSVIVNAMSCAETSGFFATACDIVTIRYDADGNQRWIKVYDGCDGETCAEDSPGDVRVDLAGNVYVAGFSEIDGLETYLTFLYDPDGTELWTHEYASTVEDSWFNPAPGHLRVTASGDVVRIGKRNSPATSHDFLTYKLVPPPCVDADGDGYGDPANYACGHPARDCDDGDPAVNPGAVEVPGNGIDDDCDPNSPPWGTPASVVPAGAPSRAAGLLLLLGLPLAVILLWRRGVIRG